MAHNFQMRLATEDKTARAIRLKDELQLMLKLVVDIRRRLENELKLSDEAQSKYIDKTFVTKLKDLASMYERLTSSHIALVKAEKAIEDAMTPAQEMQAVRDFTAALTLTDAGGLIQDLIDRFRTRGGTRVFN